MKQQLIAEMNLIAAECMKPAWYYVCLFCGKKSEYGRWMFKHILSHLKQCMEVCDECGEQHLPDYVWDYEETLEAHTITVAPEDVWRGKRWAGF